MKNYSHADKIEQLYCATKCSGALLQKTEAIVFAVLAIKMKAPSKGTVVIKKCSEYQEKWTVHWQERAKDGDE